MKKSKCHHGHRRQYRLHFRFIAYQGRHARRAYQHVCIIGDIWSKNIKYWDYVMPECNADAALHRNTHSYIWAYEH
jgi:hypothetical protein